MNKMVFGAAIIAALFLSGCAGLESNPVPMTPSNTPASSDPATTQPDNTTPGATSGNVATVKVNGRSFEF
ncbi:MAG: hypothetical protein WBA28_00295, partial [Microbacteriaceae bacterium]